MDDRIIAAKLDRLRSRVMSWSLALFGWEVRTAAHTGPGQYEFDGDWTTAACPSSFEAGKTSFLRCHVQVPTEVAKADTYMEFHVSDMDGLLSVDGQPYAGIDRNHRRTL